MLRMIVSRMQVRSLTWVTVMPAGRRPAARVSPMLTESPQRMGVRPLPSVGSRPLPHARGTVNGHSANGIPFTPPHTGRSPAASGHSPAAQRVEHIRQVVRPDEHVAGLGTLARPDDA